MSVVCLAPYRTRPCQVLTAYDKQRAVLQQQLRAGGLDSRRQRSARTGRRRNPFDVNDADGPVSVGRRGGATGAAGHGASGHEEVVYNVE